MKFFKTSVLVFVINTLLLSSMNVHSQGKGKKTLKKETVEQQTMQIKPLNLRPKISYPITENLRIGPTIISPPTNRNPGANLVPNGTGGSKPSGGGKTPGIGIIFMF